MKRCSNMMGTALLLGTAAMTWGCEPDRNGPSFMDPKYDYDPVRQAERQIDEAPPSVLDRAAADDDELAKANAEFKSTEAVDLQGHARLEASDDGVELYVEIDGAPPGDKAIHIHETDDCSDIAGKSMGGHLDPDGHEHGLPTDERHHLGDLGNLAIDEDGEGRLKLLVETANLMPDDERTLLGRAIVLHEGRDKGTGEAGDAGSPIACAPIERMN